jgi:hypothetical protein
MSRQSCDDENGAPVSPTIIALELLLKSGYADDLCPWKKSINEV